MAPEDHAICATTTSAQSKPFRLLDLPPELWSKIGRVAVDEVPRIDSYAIRKPSMDAEVYGANRKPCTGDHQPPITRACAALRHELLPYYYKSRVDVAICRSTRWLVKNTGRWLRAIGPANRNLVRGIKVRIEAPPTHVEGLARLGHHCQYSSCKSGTSVRCPENNFVELVEEEWKLKVVLVEEEAAEDCSDSKLYRIMVEE
ncbi:hypothetical protein CLAFUW4_03368 [Fulvia fulva]|uniref:Uncharacterized protein n=1 Tax=Passalora fulva TaxID=5499 RepID=A0A9Q8P4R9_PASFU|nr:uncharacterized protein CLAFUR5_03348 [Fulvia fulva]KAK4631981.1 hypothetical protein CLAFUR4_03357 [Fulvia fulva]UJO13154.1 hypothetical protein CLAFUR5_03348 [Fulvia fulva]WPV11292.1 hypothetical protein CLAFUW4_03368 [Fulvia fulva]WPV26873.1 hypothetical protein CLAFUW7_03360 [Fulvia fulva]